MTCPNCPRPVQMVPVLTMECRTGNAQLFRCPQCAARHWQQVTDIVGMNFRPLRTMNQQAAAYAQ